MSSKANRNFVPPMLNLTEANAYATALRDDHTGFRMLAQRLESLAGIHLPLNDKNVSLLAGRLAPHLRARGLKGYLAYEELLRSGDLEVEREFIASMTTHTTEFFRELPHFDVVTGALADHLRHIRRTEQREVRGWSAACSSGQEPVSILVALSESCPELFPSGIKMLATDIDLEVLRRGAAGVYSEHEMQSMPALYRQKYFDSVGNDRAAKRFQPVATIRNPITYAPFNLVTPETSMKHGFDFIFCRNVLIYFDKDTVAAVLRRLVGYLRPGGFLFLGHSESGTLRSSEVQSIATAVYRKKA